MSLSNNFPAIAPSLNLDFANVKALDPRITFTRTTTATYYDGVTTSKAEENLLLQSQDFSTTWTNAGTTETANTETAPDGTATADTITASAGASVHNIAQAATTTATQTVFSVFAKAGTHDYIQLRFGAGAGGAFCNFDITAGAGAVGTATSATGTITSVGNDWYRCSILVTPSASTAGIAVFLVTSSSAASAESWTAAGTEDVYLWGAQLEQRSAVSSYTPTTTAPITNYIPVLQTAASGVARFDHNPTTGESLGLLVEEQRTNLLVQSEDFNTTWVKARVSVTTNTIVAPDGTLTGDKIFENTDNNTHFIVGSTSFTTASASVTISVYAKKAERSIIRLQGGGAANWGTVPSAYFNLDTGVVSQTDAGTTASITPVGNGWYRCVITGTTASSGVTNPGVNIYLVSTGTTISYTGNGYDGIYIWGAQFEAGAFPTSYIATTSASVTRNADAASMTGTNFSSWFNNAEGTLYVEAQASPNSNTVYASLNDNNQSGNNVYFDNASGSIRNVVFSASSAVAVLNLSSIGTVGVFQKLAAGYKVNDFAAVRNAGSAVTDTSGNVPLNVSQLNIGRSANTLSSTYLDGTIKKIAYYPSRLTNAQLQALTS